MEDKIFKTSWHNVPFEEIPNHKFGLLRAKRLVKDGNKKERKWECECECGNTIVASENSLMKGKKSCGCANIGRRNWKELVGRKFGKLVAVEYLGKDVAGYPIMRCLCECGGESVVRAGNLQTGNTESCGCSRVSKPRKLNECNVVDGVAYLKTTDDQEFMVDEEDLPKLGDYTWCRLQNKYLVANINGVVTRLHRLIMNPPNDMVVDHINGNGFDNRKSNLRICSNAENSRNCKIGKNNKSGYTGVELTEHGTYAAKIMVDRTPVTIGCYKTFEDAKNARIAAEKKYFGDYAPSVGALKHLVGGEGVG